MVDSVARGPELLRFLTRNPHHRLEPLLARRIRELGVDTSRPPLRAVAARLERLASACALRNQLLRAQLSDAVGAFAEQGIPVCLIKGAASLADAPVPGYLDAAVRRMEDLDVVVPPQFGDAAHKLVTDRGWLCVSGTEAMPFRPESPAFVDLHCWSPQNAALGLLPLEDFFDRALPNRVGGRDVTILHPARAVQLRLVHNVIHQHLFIDFSLIDLFELSGIIAAWEGDIDWRSLRSVGLMHEVTAIFDALLLRLRDDFGAPVPDAVIPWPERRAARLTARRIEELARVPSWLYGAASRLALIRCTPGKAMDRLNRALGLFFAEPLRRRGLSPAGALGATCRMLALHGAVRGWLLFRG